MDVGQLAMKRILPNNDEGRWELALLPFATYIVATPYILMCLAFFHSLRVSGQMAPHRHLTELDQVLGALECGYIICVVALLLAAALAASYTHYKRVIRAALLLAALGVVYAILFYFALHS